MQPLTKPKEISSEIPSEIPSQSVIEKEKSSEAALPLCFAENLTVLRKAAGLTQAELAGRLNYSDKSVSKWERGEGLPDLPTAAALAALFGVTVDSLLKPPGVMQKPAEVDTGADTEGGIATGTDEGAEAAIEEDTDETPPVDPAAKRRQRIYIHLLSSLLSFLVAAAVYAVLQIAGIPFGGESPLLLFALYAFTAGGIVSTVFSCLWWGRLPKIFSVSAVCWGSALSFWLSLRQFGVEATAIFAAAGVMQLLTVLWFMMPRAGRRGSR